LSHPCGFHVQTSAKSGIMCDPQSIRSCRHMIRRGLNFWKNLGGRVKQHLKQWIKPVTTTLVTETLSDTTRSRVDLIAENAMLRQQLISLRRQIKRPQLTRADRIRLVLLARCTGVGWLAPRLFSYPSSALTSPRVGLNHDTSHRRFVDGLVQVARSCQIRSLETIPSCLSMACSGLYCH
jgi:hypothetical protein